MSIPFTSSLSAAVLGGAFTVDMSVTAESGVKCEPDTNLAQAGALTTRTSASVGTVTMTSGAHTVATGDRVDIYWTGGSRYGVTVGTVSGTAVPFTGGAGTDLPVATTAVTVCVASAADMVVTGSNVVGIALSMTVRGTIVIATSGGAECHSVVFADGGGAYVWTSQTGVTNPLSGDSVAKVFATQAGTATASKGVAAVAYN